MRGWTLTLVLIGCGDTGFTTVQPEAFWVDLGGTPVTRGEALTYVDDQGVTWTIDWQSASLSGPAYPQVLYGDDSCGGLPYLAANVPPLHAMWDADDEVWKMVREDARVERLEAGYTKASGCSKVAQQPVVFDLRNVLVLGPSPRLLPFVPPLRKVLPAGEP